ncbi:GEM-like protein 4 [Populus alba x Populus x berolinensis]|nr:GEM-like protein 4 [Populus alba x Populus x berolinensis]
MMNKLGMKADNFANGVRGAWEYFSPGTILSFKFNVEFLHYPNNGLPVLDNFETAVRLGPKISETVKEMLSLGAKILQVGGVEKIFLQLFVGSEDEKLLKASQCYLSTTAGPIAGLLYIHQNLFSEWKSVRVHYKVLVPLKKIKKCLTRVSMLKKAIHKSIWNSYSGMIFDFWFMGIHKIIKKLSNFFSRQFSNLR